MSADPNTVPGAPPLRMGFRVFVALIAATMALNALAIDVMLPALPLMARDFGLATVSKAQWIIAAYVLGFGVAQLIYGPLSDRFGRRPILLFGILAYIATAAIAAMAKTFELMIAARVLQGIAAASSRTVAVAIVRDCFAGRQMARVMSLAFIVFLIVPILAPSIGQLVLLVAPWHGIFLGLVGYASILFVLTWWLMPETLHPEYRQPLNPARIIEAAGRVISDRLSLGYTIATTLLFGSLMGFINSSQQIFATTFGAGDLFPIVFALAAGTMAVGSFVNSRIVERVGTRRISHMAMFGFSIISAIHLLIALAGYETIWSFSISQAGVMGCFALCTANFSSMAMERLGPIAGTASSVQGFSSTIGGALIGIAIGQAFDGTTLPLTLGYLAVGIGAIITVLVTERGRLFQGNQPPHPIRS